MDIQRVNHNSGSISTFKIIGLVIVIFIGGLISGISLLGLTPANNDVLDNNNLDLKEDLKMKNAEIWLVSDPPQSQAGILLVNEGNADAKITEITIRGITCAWSNVYFWKTNIGSVTGELEASSNDLSGSTVSIDIEGEERVFQQATQDIILDDFQAMILYLKNPVNITQPTVPDKVMLAVFTEKSMCSEEISLVPTTIGFMDTKTVTITNVAFANDNEITVSVKNTGTSNVTISTAKVNGVVTTIAINPSPVGTGLSADVVLTSAYTAGNAYKMDLYDSSGQLVGAYQATAS